MVDVFQVGVMLQKKLDFGYKICFPNERSFLTHPNQQLRDGQVPDGARQVQGRPQIPTADGGIDVFDGGIRQQDDDGLHVRPHDGFAQLLADWRRWVEGRKELLSFVLQPDPAFLLLPRTGRGGFHPTAGVRFPHGVGEAVADGEHHAEVAGTKTGRENGGRC